MEATAAPAPVQNPNPNPNPNPPSISGWSNIVKKQADQKPQTSDPTAATQLFVESCKSTKGIAMAVVDANAIIQGGDTLSNYADKFVSVPEVMAEVRDPVSRHRLAFTPFQVQTMEPSPESLNKVIKFARATGDLQTLSDVDLKLIALTYTLEAQIHGTDHLRDCPPPVHTVNVRRLPEKDLPGWGNNVPNLEEWEALEDAEEENSNPGSRVLPLKDINLNVVDSDSLSVDGASVEVKSDAQFENQEDGLGTERRYRRNFPKKKEIKIEGKKMVSDGIDASQGQFDDNAGEWMPAVSRSTHRRFLRRKARRESCEAFSEKDAQQDAEDSACGETVDEARSHDQLLPVDSEEACHGDGTSEASDIAKAKNGDEGLSSILKQTRLEEDSLRAFQEGKETNGEEADGFDAEEATADNANLAADRDEVEMINEGLDHLEISSQTNESVDTSNLNDDHSEQSWMLRSLSESSVACITGDFAMQNVILQMGLRLVAPGGMQIRQLHRWILKCHACNTVTAEIGKIFCPKCGNGGTLRKVAVTVGENGIVLEARRTRFQLRGTRFSLPLPRGGRDAITKNPILREDQLPQKFLHQKTKKKAAYKEGDEIFTTNDFIFCHHTDKRAPLQPPMRKALAVFSGRRNPNDNHYSHPKH